MYKYLYLHLPTKCLTGKMPIFENGTNVKIKLSILHKRVFTCRIYHRAKCEFPNFSLEDPGFRHFQNAPNLIEQCFANPRFQNHCRPDIYKMCEILLKNALQMPQGPEKLFSLENKCNLASWVQLMIETCLKLIQCFLNLYQCY